MYSLTPIPSESTSTPQNATRYAGCKCKYRKCKTFREHVGTGPYVSGSATPTRNGSVREKLETEKRWDKEIDAFKRLDKQGYTLNSLDGADKIEQRATSEIELKHSKLYGEKLAKEMEQRVKDSE